MNLTKKIHEEIGTHYIYLGERTFKVFTLGKCENCGGDVQEVNAVNLIKPPSHVLDRLTNYEPFNNGNMPPEIFWDDELNMTVCEMCEGKGRIVND